MLAVTPYPTCINEVRDNDTKQYTLTTRNALTLRVHAAYTCRSRGRAVKLVPIFYPTLLPLCTFTSRLQLAGAPSELVHTICMTRMDLGMQIHPQPPNG